MYNIQKFMPTKNTQIVFFHFVGSLKPWGLNVNRFKSDTWKEFYYSSAWGNIELNNILNLKPHYYRIMSKYLWRNKQYHDSVKKYFVYLMKKLRVI